MLELTEKEIEKISSDIDQQGLTYTLLKDELLDHICCDIEEEMENGLTFNEAYRKVKGILGKKRIRQIQDETLYLISKKYRIMKKLMYVLGIAVPILIILGAIFKVMHWPGGGLIISLALFTTGVLFLPVFVMVRIRDTRKLDETVPMGLYLTGMISGVITILGTLFKIQHWPGGGVLISLGLFALAAVFLPMYAVVKIRNAREKEQSFNKGYYITGVIAGILFIAGALFKIMHWPGAGYVIIVSWLSVAVLFLPILVLNVLKQKTKHVDNFFFIILVASFIAVILMALLRVPSKITIDEFILSEESIAANAGYLAQQNDRQLKEAADFVTGENLHSMQAVSAEADNICDFIQSAKQEMALQFSEENRAFILPDGRIDFRKVIGRDARSPSEIIMIGRPDSQGGKAYEIRSMLESFIKTSISVSSDKEFKILVEGQIDLSVPSDSGQGWEAFYFSGPMIQTATHLSRYQSGVRMIESELLQELAGRLEVE